LHKIVRYQRKRIPSRYITSEPSRKEPQYFVILGVLDSCELLSGCRDILVVTVLEIDDLESNDSGSYMFRLLYFAKSACANHF